MHLVELIQGLFERVVLCLQLLGSVPERLLALAKRFLNPTPFSDLLL